MRIGEMFEFFTLEVDLIPQQFIKNNIKLQKHKELTFKMRLCRQHKKLTGLRELQGCFIFNGLSC